MLCCHVMNFVKLNMLLLGDYPVKLEHLMLVVCVER